MDDDGLVKKGSAKLKGLFNDSSVCRHFVSAALEREVNSQKKIFPFNSSNSFIDYRGDSVLTQHSSVSGLHSSKLKLNKCLYRIRFLPPLRQALKGYGLNLGCFNSDCRVQVGSVKRRLRTRVTEKPKTRAIKPRCLFSEHL